MDDVKRQHQEKIEYLQQVRVQRQKQLETQGRGLWTVIGHSPNRGYAIEDSRGGVIESTQISSRGNFAIGSIVDTAQRGRQIAIDKISGTSTTDVSVENSSGFNTNPTGGFTSTSGGGGSGGEEEESGSTPVFTRDPETGVCTVSFPPTGTPRGPNDFDTAEECTAAQTYGCIDTPNGAMCVQIPNGPYSSQAACVAALNTPPFPGGQCSVGYRIVVDGTGVSAGNLVQEPTLETTATGPILDVYLDSNIVQYTTGATSGEFNIGSWSVLHLPLTITSVQVIRLDGTSVENDIAQCGTQNSTCPI